MGLFSPKEFDPGSLYLGIKSFIIGLILFPGNVLKQNEGLGK